MLKHLSGPSVLMGVRFLGDPMKDQGDEGPGLSDLDHETSLSKASARAA